ncbi:type-F conjugative transfer system pilin assembly protein TrbC [Novosphingobium sp. KA1]|uniref:type-F conjugative transfer system pilin assembly protein TrbC n=1 Tax=Novosphingobium sp. (strain KA1) TaxID=164608 RepID=UPI001F5C67E6|nr:type-F conjugative transfer system pilin assembly protein TrbC [Novosphingobium sp. KA1]
MIAQPARQAIGDEGSEAMERLRNALQNAKNEASSAPVSIRPPAPAPAEKRRAFEGLKRRSANPAMEVRARAANELAQKGLAAERERQARLLRQTLGLEPSEEQGLAKAGATPSTPKSWTPLLFASSSMPMPVLRSYAAQLERVHGVIAFRGLPGGMKKIAPFAKLSAEMLRIDPGCEGPACAMRDVQIVVDPIVFRQYAVSRVPALAMVPGDPTQPYCERGDEAAATPNKGARPNTHVVYGDSALAGLLDEYARLGGKEEVRDAQSLLTVR